MEEYAVGGGREGGRERSVGWGGRVAAGFYDAIGVGPVGCSFSGLAPGFEIGRAHV